MSIVKIANFNFIRNILRQRKLHKISKALKNNDPKTLGNAIIPINQVDDYAKMILRNKKDEHNQDS